MNVQLRCVCGKVRGVAHNVTSQSINRIVCHCDDCQAFANYLHTENSLDTYGGTDIVQMPLSEVEITQGEELLRSIKLTPTGMYRWYTECCRTPIGNTLSAAVPFIGMIHTFMDIDDKQRDEVLGPVRGYVQTKFALKTTSSERVEVNPVANTIRMLYKMVTWKLKSFGKSTAFFDTKGNPIAKPTILSL